jgi:hypothetical protein
MINLILIRKAQYSAILLACFLLFNISGIQTPTERQNQENHDPYEPIPASIRPKLFNRLREFVKLQAHQEWKKMYDLSIQSVRKPYPSRDEFVKERHEIVIDQRSWKLTKFTPQSAQLVNLYGDEKEWSIDGCARYLQKNKPIYLESATIATFHNGLWYFSDLATKVEVVGGPVIPCRTTD